MKLHPMPCFPRTRMRQKLLNQYRTQKCMMIMEFLKVLGLMRLIKRKMRKVKVVQWQ